MAAATSRHGLDVQALANLAGGVVVASEVFRFQAY
jgi:hypothetical protein